ncbi:hypothetical protein GGH96_001355 [Coemansia sp. RSA 1972]|nr:hypothetical protein GGH96_001355 [Coemansia sp. RSA 1972]
MSSSRRLSSAGPLTGLAVGHAVEVQGSRGIVRFSGTTEFASGKWFGVELEEAQGKNDGSVQGKRYFECPPGHGVFVRSSQVKVLTSSAERAPRATIHGAEIQGIRAPSSVPNADALRAARRATVQPSRIAASPASAIAPPSRIGGVLAQRSQPTAGARRMSGVPTMGAPRRSTLTGARSPASPGLRQTSGSESATSRPMSREQSISREQTLSRESPVSREQTLSRKQSISRMETPSPVGGKADVAEQELDREPEEAPQTPTKEIETAKEAPRTPYRPALSMDEASAFDTGPALAAQTVPLKQYEELRLKFKFLEQKRSEDRQRLQEADKMRSEAEQALRVREKLAAKVSAQQADMRTLRQQLKDATMARDDAEAKYTETLDAMEMLAVDKEMAEERAEALVQEASVLREQLDDPDVGAGSHMDEQAEEPAQLQRQNARLKEALVRLRDVAAESEATLGQRVKQLEREAVAAAEQALAAQGLRAQLQAAEAQIEDLKERLDDALGAEELIESLSERNLDLGAQVEELQGAVESLEALCEVNNEMEETRAEEEQGLRAELERMSAVASARARRVDALEEAVADRQHTAEQYRELVATLQADVQGLRAREQTQAGEVASAALQAQQALSLNLQLRSTALRTRARAVDLELRRLDTDQATERLAMTEPFLPDHFFRTEAGALGAVLSVRRLAAKADVLCAQLEQDEAAASISDAFVAAADVRAQLSQFSGGAALLAGYLSTCSAADFAHAQALQTDAQGMERRLNGLIDLVRSEEFRAPDALPEVRRLTAQLREMADAHVPQTLEAMAPQRLTNAASRLAFAADEQLANLVFAEQLLAEPETESLVFADADRQVLAMRVLPAMASVVQNCKAAKLPALKLLRQADDMLRANVAANDRAFELADDVLLASDELRDYSVRVRSVVQNYFVSASGDDGEPIVEAVSLERLQQDLASIAQDVFGATEATPLGLALSVSQRLGRELSALLSFVGDDQNAQAADRAEAPWVARAQQFKSSLVQNTDVERRTRELEEEIVSVRRELKLRDQALREGSVKTEMLEKRADTMRRQAEQVGELRKLLDGAHIKEKTYDEALESLQSEMDALEAECRRLRQAEAAAKHAIQAGHAATGAPMPTDLLGLRNKIVALQGSLVYLRRENAHLRAKSLASSELPELHVPMQRSPGVAEAVREARNVAKEACRLAAMPRLVSLAAKAPCAWQPLASRPQFELYRQQALAQTLKQRVEGVQERLRAIPRLPMVV